MRLSVVSTLYRSAPFLREFHQRVSAAVARLLGPDQDYEIILVNDGSPDNSLEVALELQATDPHIRIVDLSRNFGHHQAMWTGLQHACGDDVFLLDCDLQEAPEWLTALDEARRAARADVAFGVQDSRAGGWIERWTGAAFYKVFNALCDDPIPVNLMTIRLMSRRYVDALLQHTEATFTISGLWARTGFRQAPVPLTKSTRRGRTTYNFLSRVQLFIHALTAFSGKPLVFVFYLGAAITGMAAFVATILVGERLFFGVWSPGWPSLMVSIWLLGGLIIFCQGLQGLYLARMFVETKRRPITFVRHVYEPHQEANRDYLRLAQ